LIETRAANNRNQVGITHLLFPHCILLLRNYKGSLKYASYRRTKKSLRKHASTH